MAKIWLILEKFVISFTEPFSYVIISAVEFFMKLIVHTKISYEIMKFIYLVYTKEGRL